MTALTHAETCDLATWTSPNGRSAFLRLKPGPSLRLVLLGDAIHETDHAVWYALRDTPQIRSHLRALALDWCAHGVTPTGPTASDTGPRRGAMTLSEANRLGGWGLLKAQMRVREDRGPGWPDRGTP